MELFFRDTGGAGEPLVVLHGMLGSSRNWTTVAKDLAAAGRRVLVPDMRNHGASPHASEMGYPVLAADVLEWLDRLGISRFSLIGHSMGGKVAMLLACRHAARVARLVVVDIAPKDYRWVGHRLEFAAMHDFDLAHLGSRAEAEMRLEGRVPDLGLRKFLTTNLERNADGPGWRWTVNLPAITAALPILEKNPLGAADRYDGPTRFIAGGRSRYVDPQADWPAIQAHFPRAELVVLPEAGHNPHFDARPAFVAAVTGPAAVP